MAGNEYRRGKKQLNVLVSLALLGKVRAAAADAGVSVQEWVVGVLRERVAEGECVGVTAVDGFRLGADQSSDGVPVFALSAVPFEESA